MTGYDAAHPDVAELLERYRRVRASPALARFRLDVAGELAEALVSGSADVCRCTCTRADVDRGDDA